MTTALVIGAGPAGLMAADVLSAAGHQVIVTDQMPSVGRKLLMAGKSGLNLTKAQPIEAFLAGFGDVPDSFRAAIRAFGPQEVQDWATGLGQAVFTGSTGRVFPDVMKASPLLRAWLSRLTGAGVTLRTRHKWQGWEGSHAVFETPEGRITLTVDVTVLAMGGASWARLGSDGAWAKHVAPTTPFKPANCGFAMNWTPHMAPFFGQPVKATALKAGALRSRGEWVITPAGIEGGGIYEVAAAVRDGAPLVVDLLPDVKAEDVAKRIKGSGKSASRSEILKKRLRLSPAKIALMNEFGRGDPHRVADLVKALPLAHAGPLPLEGAISTAGGVAFSAVDAQFMLRDRPGVFVAGEMLDWEAPTGGYLITGCLATGRVAGRHAAHWAHQSGS